MFTGLIETIGTLEEIRHEGESAQIIITAPDIASELTRGESVAVDGACLTVEDFTERFFSVYASRETLKRTTLRHAGMGQRLNLERALRLGDRLGGHLVAGHVDTVGSVGAWQEEDAGWTLWVNAPAEFVAQCVLKGSVAVDGVSLTLMEIRKTSFSIAVIPETQQATALGGKEAGAAVNLESDMIGKYVRQYVQRLAPGDERQAGSVLDLLINRG